MALIQLLVHSPNWPHWFCFFSPKRSLSCPRRYPWSVLRVTWSWCARLPTAGDEDQDKGQDRSWWDALANTRRVCQMAKPDASHASPPSPVPAKPTAPTRDIKRLVNTQNYIKPHHNILIKICCLGNVLKRGTFMLWTRCQWNISTRTQSTRFAHVRAPCVRLCFQLPVLSPTACGEWPFHACLTPPLCHM